MSNQIPVSLVPPKRDGIIRQLVCQMRDFNNIVPPETDDVVEFAESYAEAVDALQKGNWTIILLSEHLKDNSSEKIARFIANNPDKSPTYLYFLNVSPEKGEVLKSIVGHLYPRD